MQPTTALPDNFKSRVSRLYVADREFKDDSGQPVKYRRLVIELMVKGEVFELEYKPEKKDLAILMLADQVDGATQF